MLAGDHVTLTMAYKVRKGNPFKRWQPLDFNFDESKSLTVVAKGIKVSSKTKNEVSFIVKKPGDWQLSISGFSNYRDLEVRDTLVRTKGKA